MAGVVTASSRRGCSESSEAAVPTAASTAGSGTSCSPSPKCRNGELSKPASSSSDSSKKLPRLLSVMHQHFGENRPLRYFCMDESRWGLKTELGRRITLKGVKPVRPCSGLGPTVGSMGPLRSPAASPCSISSPIWTLSASSAF